ncbi:hypothetical protein G4D82_05790 [Flavobacterium sp. CYK-4]|uniref:tail fiber domain-containing protein n=1 Tax=Flavobacterium lotistagni TaxID=2709660 RepID=UPI00140A2B0E|nr:tail fiber domain-containing protein [Flavobacterium lotistagni]NHM06723.1 hypothetical protein [Flavobacterium lotistagni]
MKTRLQLLFIVCFIAQAMSGQVGINTTTPNAQLEIKSSNQATPANTDGVIIPKIDAFPATNPTAAQQGMMVYLTTTSAGKSPGFYYWNNPTTTWLALGGTDDDWSGAGTGVMKSNYNTDKVTIGPGAGTASKLDVVTGNGAGLFNGLKVNNNNTSAGGITYGATIENNATGTNPKYGIYSSVSLDGTGPKTALMTGLETSTSQTQSAVGIENIVNAPGTGERTGIDNQLFSLNPLNTSDVAGVKNYFEDSNNGKTLGVSNQFDGSAGGNVSTYEITGLKNQFDNAGLSPKFGCRNIFSAYSAGEQVGVENQFLSSDNSSHYGIKSTFEGSGNLALTYGSYNYFRSGVNSYKYGSYNFFQSTSNDDYGQYNYFESFGRNTAHYGLLNRFNGDGGNMVGVENDLLSSGTAHAIGVSNYIIAPNGAHGIYTLIDDSTTDNTQYVFGNYAQINGSGLTRYYGSYAQLNNSNAASTEDRFGYAAEISSAGGTGTNYGIYSMVPDDSNSYSGYFLGRVSIGPNDGFFGTNNYIMPLQRGTNGQIMQTDASGNVTWQNPSSVMGNVGWLLNGNSGTNPDTHFIGTSDNADLVFKRNATVSGKIGINATSFGLSALGLSATTLNNSAFGKSALSANTTGDNNCAFGHSALLSNITSNSNSAFGSAALRNNNAGSNNSAVGAFSLYSNLSGNFNVAQGIATMYYNSSGSSNVAIGSSSMYSNNSGNNNTAVGTNTLYTNTASDNVAVGNNALFGNSSGTPNTAVGSNAMSQNSTGNNNAALGYYALASNSTGNQNTAIGVDALRVSTANNNTALGYRTAYQQTGGTRNVAIGSLALSGLTNNSFNTAVGSSTYITGNFSNSMALGDGVTVTANNQVRVGDTGIASIGGQVGWTTLSDKRFKEDIQENVPGLSFISKLKPVTYHVNARKVYDFTHKDQSDDEKVAYVSQLPSSVYSGFLAQDVEAAAQSIGYEFSGVDKPKNENDYYGLRYGEFVVPLVKAVQEQQQIIEQQQKQLQDLATRLEKLEQFIKR